MRNITYQSCREIQNTQFNFSDIFPKIRPFRDEVEKYGRDI
jgi:cbb3-type cytochrome oxidase cytochrome c subunit